MKRPHVLPAAVTLAVHTPETNHKCSLAGDQKWTPSPPTPAQAFQHTTCHNSSVEEKFLFGRKVDAFAFATCPLHDYWHLEVTTSGWWLDASTLCAVAQGLEKRPSARG